MDDVYTIISIITPSFNQGRFIERTIKSVLAQEGNFYLEYIILDAGSKDSSVEIIKKYDRLLKEGGFPVKCLGITYRWSSEPDRGQTDALNKGLKMAGGTIVNWLNSDDWYLPGTLEKIRRAFLQNPGSNFILGHVYFVDEEGKVLRGDRAKTRLPEIDFRHQNPLTQPAVFFTKELLGKIGFLDEGLDVTMDYDFWVRAMRRGCVFTRINDFLANVTLTKKAKSSVFSPGIWVESLLVQLRYFGFNGRFIHNWSRYASDYSEWTVREPEEAFAEITEGLSRRCTEEQGTLLTRHRQRALMLCCLKKATRQTETSKKAALRRGFFVLAHAPFLFFTRSGVVFLMRLFLKPGYYLRAKELSINWFRKSRHFFKT